MPPARLCSICLCAALFCALWIGDAASAAIYATNFFGNVDFSGSLDVFDETTGASVQANFITSINSPSSIVVGPDNNFYVASRFDGKVFAYTPDGNPLAGTPGAGGLYADLTGTFGQPGGLAFDTLGNLYVADNGSDTISVFDGTSTLPVSTLQVPNGGTPLGGLTFDAADSLYVSSFTTGEVYKYNGSTFDTLVAAGAGGLALASGLVVDDTGNLYVAGLGSNAVHKYDSGGSHLENIIIPFIPPPTASFFPSNAPSGVLIDSGGDLLISVLGATNPGELIEGDPFPLGGILRYTPGGSLEILTQNTGAFSSLVVVPTFDPADTDVDGDVDTADLTTMFQNFTGDVGGAGGKTMMDGDTDTDGDVDTADLTTGLQNFTGTLNASLGGSSTAVPEPGSMALLVLGLMSLAACRGRRGRERST